MAPYQTITRLECEYRIVKTCRIDDVSSGNLREAKENSNNRYCQQTKKTSTSQWMLRIKVQ